MITLDPKRTVSSAVRRPQAPATPQASAPAPQQATPGESSQVAGLPARIASLSAAEVAQVRDDMSGAEYVPGELLVKLNAGSEPGLMGDFASEYGAQVVERFDIPKNIFKSFDGELLRLKLPQGIEVAEAVAAMQKDDRVVYAEGNEVIRLPETIDGEQTQAPDDLSEKLWGLNNTGQNGGTAGADISALEAWEVTTGDGSDNGPLIAVIDTGIDYNHPDLKANLWTNPGEIPGNGVDDDGNGVIDDVHGYNAFADSGDPLDGHSHGTHCAGTIGAVGNNGEGVTGVMQNANLMAVKIFSDSGRTSADAIVRGILYSAKMGADITSNSWGGGGRSQAIYDAFASNPALHVIAAGNSNYDNDKRDNFPSNYDLDNIVAVAATNRHDNRASFSQWGAKNVDVAAPGRDIWSTVPGGYGNKSGTSMATPHVSGVAGLIASAFPDASPLEIKDRLIYGSDRVDSLTDISVSDGRVNAAASLEDDSVAPGTPSRFSLSGLSTRGIDVSWNIPGDDGDQGNAASMVELRVDSKAINDDNYSEAPVYATAGGGNVGDTASVNYSVVPSEVDRPVFFAAQAVDNVGNRSELARGITVIPAADLELAEDFDGQQPVFTASGNFRQVEAEGRGKVFVSTPTEGDAEPTSALTSPALNLEGKKNAYLKFEAKTNLYWGNNASVEVSEDGENWTSVSRLDRRGDWAEHGVDLSAFDGKSIQVRFKVDTRNGKTREGLSLDNVKVLSEEA